MSGPWGSVIGRPKTGALYHTVFFGKQLWQVLLLRSLQQLGTVQA